MSKSDNFADQLCYLVGVALCLLKLAGLLDWDWAIVVLPFFVPFVATISALMLASVVAVAITAILVLVDIVSNWFKKK